MMFLLAVATACAGCFYAGYQRGRRVESESWLDASKALPKEQAARLLAGVAMHEWTK
jgi:hypothetical protein